MIHALRAAAILLLVVASACGGSPPAPSGTMSIAGAWSGTWTFNVAGVTASDQVTVSFTQSGQTANGTLQAGNGTTGTLSLPATATTSGTLTLAVTTLSGTCAGTAPTGGTIAAAEIRLTTPVIMATVGNCQWATDLQFVLHR